MIVRLAEPAGILMEAAAPATGPVEAYEREGIFVYEGTFMSMDGEVTVTAAQIRKLAANHNTKYMLRSLQAAAAGKELAPADCPPVQLDHSASARDTVGRVVGSLAVVEYTPEMGGKALVGLLGRIRFLGAENCQKAVDGRFTHLSIGADFEEGTLNELTVTPFPAAQNAVMLASKRSSKQLSQGDDMDKEKLKAHLKRKGMSAEEADKHLASCDDDAMKKLAAEADEEDKKLAAAEEEEKKKLAAAEADEKKDKDAKMAATREGFVRLAQGMKKSFSSSTTEMRKTTIAQRLAGLRTGNKLTPAEQKKIDVVQLAAKSDAEVEAFFSAFESREPMVITGQQGTAKAEPVAKLATTHRKAADTSMHLAHMPFTKGALKAKYGVDEAGNVKIPGQTQLTAVPGSRSRTKLEGAPSADTENLNARFTAVCKLMDEGKRDEALKHLKSWMESMHFSSEAASGDGSGSARMSALAEENKKLQNQFEELVTLVAPLVGVTSSDLSA